MVTTGTSLTTMTQLPDNSHQIQGEIESSEHGWSTCGQDVDELLPSTTEVDAIKCVEMTEKVKIYKRVLALVYIQFQLCYCNAETAHGCPPGVEIAFSDSVAFIIRESERFFNELTRWHSWDVIQSLYMQNAIRATLWEILQTCGASNQVKLIVEGHYLREMLNRDKADLTFQIEEITKDQLQRQRLLELLDLDAGITGSDRWLVRTTAKLAKKSRTYPDCLSLAQIEFLGVHPVTGDGFADISSDKDDTIHWASQRFPTDDARRPEAKYVCPVPGCGSKFVRHFNLRVHMRSHSGEKPFKCESPGCGELFSRQLDCKRHELRHHSIGSYICQGCRQQFADIDSLNQHRAGCTECLARKPILTNSDEPSKLVMRTVVKL